MRLTPFAAIIGVAALGLLAGAAPQSSSSPLEFLEGDEHYFPFANDCGRIYVAAPVNRAALEQSFRQSTWSGECPLGLAHGVGVEHDPRHYINPGDRLETRRRYVYGHSSPYVDETINLRDGIPIASDPRYFLFDSNRVFATQPFEAERRTLTLPALGEATPAAPLIWDNMLPADSNKVTRLLARVSDADGMRTYELSSVCDPSDVATFPASEQRRARSVCRGAGVPTAYSIVVLDQPKGTRDMIYQRRLCADAPRGNGCVALWMELTGEHHAAWTEIQQEARRAHTAWAAEIGRRYAAAVEAQAQGDRRARAAAQDEQAAFEQGLETASAGELFARADEMFEAGRTDRARAALRALIRRFPDSPLAARAADQLASMSTPQATAQATRSAPATSGGASSGGCSVSATNAVSAFNGDFRNMRTQRALNPAWGTRDTYQYSYFLGVEGLKILADYRTCMSPADFQANKAALEGMRDQGLRGCEQTSSGYGTCVPEYPG